MEVNIYRMMEFTAILLLFTCGCSNVCQNLCEEWYNFKKGCGEDISYEDITDCKKDYQYLTEEEESACEDDIAAMEEWICDDIN